MSQAESNPESGPSVILNVNDDAARRSQVTRLLHEAGFVVVEAENGEAALRLAHTSDLVVLDVRLPDISGREVCRRLRADPVTAALPVLHTYGKFTAGERRGEGLDDCADGYLAQPFEAVELVGTVRSLLRARRAEEAVRATVSDWQATFNGISDGVCLLGTDARVRRTNPAFRRLLALDEAGLVEAALPRPLDEILPPSLHNLVRALIEGRRRVAEAAVGDRYVALECDCLEEGSGWVLIVSDITERRRLEEERLSHTQALAEASERKDEFLAMLAHELRNPLNAISTSLHLQNIYGAQDARNQRLRATVSRQTAHLARLVDDLLDVSQLTRGAIVLRREVIDLARVLEGAIESSRTAIQARRQTLEVTMPSAPLWIDGDAMRLEQVLINLLANAAKYSEPGQSIWLSAAVEGGAAVVRVRDEGIGIAPEMQGAIFEMFRQVDSALDRTGGGLGIGLTVVRSLAEMHGGTVTVTSGGRGQGSEFTVRLPLHTAARKGDSKAPGKPYSRETKRRVLVVEDNLEALEMIQMALEIAGYSVETASDGMTGLELALANRPDVALVDVGLPGLDGYQLAERVRADPSCAAVYLVAVTGYGRPEDRAHALRSGFNAHIVKPVRTAQILAMVEGAPHAGPQVHADAAGGTA